MNSRRRMCAPENRSDRTSLAFCSERRVKKFTWARGLKWVKLRSPAFNRQVGFTPNSGHGAAPRKLTQSATYGRLRVGKTFSHFAALVGAAMCSAF